MRQGRPDGRRDARAGGQGLLGRHAESDALEALVRDALGGHSRVLILRGEAGIGKSALLAHFAAQLEGWRVAHVVGVESELELAFSGLHQICAPMLDRLDRLPDPQRQALSTVFGLSAGPAPERFLVGLATLTLLAEVAEQQPLALIVDDAHWLDQASEQTLAFVARRLLADRIAILGAARTGIGDHVLAGLPELRLGGLADADARALLLDNVAGPIDAAVCDQIVAESHGNPLALLELPRSGEFVGGFGVPGLHPVARRIEDSYTRRLDKLPSDARLLLLVAAAEPRGDPSLLHRAVTTLGIDVTVAEPAVEAGLIALEPRVEFAHPLVRSTTYRTATADDRRRVHGALADATDAESDPDRRAWHRACAARMPDEEVAAELERSAGRAQARGGLAAAAAFFERAAELSPDHGSRAQRTLRAADSKQLAGEPQSASKLLAAAADGPLDERDGALAQRLKGQIAIDLRLVTDAGPLLLDAARRLQSIEPEIARETYLEAIRAGCLAGRFGGDMLHRAAKAAQSARPPDGAAQAGDLLLAGLAARFTDGYAAAAPLLMHALRAFRAEDGQVDQSARWPGFARAVALELFDHESCTALYTRSVQLARERGALGVLPLALDYLATLRSFEGNLDAAETLVKESDSITDAIGAAPFGVGRFPLAGLRGEEEPVSALTAAIEPVARARGEGALLTKGEYAKALLYNGLGRYESAVPVAERASRCDGETFSTHALTELVEAAARSGKGEVAATAVERLIERTDAAGTEWALGTQARARALLSDGSVAEELYREAIERLAASLIGAEHARAQLVYGEWLRRAGRRVDAREQLRSAHELFIEFGMDAFAERARRERLATGEHVRKREAAAREELTAQEAQIAELASDGHTNAEIAAQLFLSNRTVEWHLRKVFVKLGIGSRRELEAALPARARAGQAA